MPGIENNLYPPIIDTWMPAFVRTAACRIYFSLSAYNDIAEIANAQIVINNQNSNQSALDPNEYPTGIKISNIFADEERITDDRYYVIIYPNDLVEGAFELNQFYKVQIRFTSTGASPITSSTRMAEWLSDNQKFFSEWSTVCLIKGIEQPEIYLRGFTSEQVNSEIIFTTDVIDLVGRMYYNLNETLEKESLKYYSATIYNETTGDKIYETGNIYTNEYNPNEINYTLKIALEDGIKYRLKFYYTTINEYSNSKSFIFSILQNSIEALDATITAEGDVENGRIKINVISNNSEIFFGNIVIRRSSSKTNFMIWEDIHQTTIVDGEPLNYVWYDYTVESGTWYKYCAQKRDSKGIRGVSIVIRSPILMEFDDMFLTRQNMQFRIKYDPTVSSFRYNYLEAKIDTLGSKYPHIRRNGNVKYRQFPISGLITAFCDEEGIFLNKDNIFNEAKENYDLYNEQNNIDAYQDYIYEREFRNKIIDFLYEDNVKLFRSRTEGNILVRLMDVSFTPNQTLGRMLYSFSATAYEIDEPTLDNYKKYGIQTVGEYSEELVYTYDKIGQISGTFSGKGQDLLALLKEKYEEITATSDYLNTINKVKWLRIEFVSDPYLIRTSGSSLTKMTRSQTPNENTAYGYIVYVNNKPMVVSFRSFIEFIDEDTNITSVYFPYDTEVIFDYMIEISQTENPQKSFSKIYYNVKVGQLHGWFTPNENLFRDIYLKYYIDYTRYKQTLNSINKVTFEADPGTVIYVKDSFDEDYFKHELGPTGVLELFDSEAILTGFYFSGMHLYPIEDNREEVIRIIDQETGFTPVKDDALSLSEDETTITFNAVYFKQQFGTDMVVKDSVDIKDIDYFDSKVVTTKESKIRIPQKNGVYVIDGQRKIYYKNEWYDFTEDDEALCPIDGTVDYIYELMRGEY